MPGALRHSSHQCPFSEFLYTNGKTWKSNVRYLGSGATANDWGPDKGRGEVLNLASSGSAPTPDRGSPFKYPIHRSAKFNNGKVYQAASAATANLTTNCFVLELWFTYGGSAQHILNHQLTVGNNEGWLVMATIGNRILVSVSDNQPEELHASVDLQTTLVSTLVTGNNYHLMAFFNFLENSANGSKLYLNGVAASNGFNPFGMGSCNSSALLTVGLSYPLPSSNKFQGSIIGWQAWMYDNMLEPGASGQTGNANIALRRYLAAL